MVKTKGIKLENLSPTDKQITAEIRIRQNQLTELWLSTKSQFDGLDQSRHPQKELKELNVRLRELCLAYDSFRVELAGLTDPTLRLAFEKEGKSHKRNLESFRVDLEWREQRIKDDQTVKTGDDVERPQILSSDNLMHYGVDTSKDSTQSLQRTLAKVNETRHLARIAKDDLSLQTEQLELVMEGAFDMEESLKRSKRSILELARTVYTDSVLKVLIAGVFITIMAMVIVDYINKNS